MYYSLKADCYFRRYGEIGYISRPIIAIEEVVDEMGSLFLEKLSYEPRNIDVIVNMLIMDFSEVNKDNLKKDAIEFYTDLASDGFLIQKNTFDEVIEQESDLLTLERKLTYTTLKPQLEDSSSYFLEEYGKKAPFLRTFHIEVSSKCNERCIHCYIPHEDKIEDIEYDTMMDVLKQCRAMNVMTLIFSGGEPMLHPHFCEFLKCAKDMDFNVEILSNLTVVTNEIIDALTYKHASCVSASLYSMIPEIHDSITTVSKSHEKTVSNILRLIEHNVPVQINCPVMKQNRDSFYEVIKWGQSHKCMVNTDYLIMARSDRTTDNLTNRLSKDDLHIVINHFLENDVIIQNNVEKIVEDDSVEIMAKSSDRVCGVGITTLCMVANGDIYPCAGWQKYICGNIKDTPLQEIWEESQQIRYLRSLRQNDFKMCIGCEDKDFCSMCMSRNSNENKDGDIFVIPQITCDAARIHHQMVEKKIKEKALSERK